LSEREKLTDHFIDDTFVGVEIEGETGVTVCVSSVIRNLREMDGLFFDEDARSSLCSLGTNTTLQIVFQHSMDKKLV